MVRMEPQVRQVGVHLGGDRHNNFLVAATARSEDIENSRAKAFEGQNPGGEAGCGSRVQIWLVQAAVMKALSPL